MSSTQPYLFEPKPHLVLVIYIRNASIMDTSSQIPRNQWRFLNRGQEHYFTFEIIFEIQ
jgi:hypothetical protein